MKLVCLEVLIVSIATRAMFALIGKPPPLPDVVWGVATLATALVASVILIADALAAVRARASSIRRTSRSSASGHTVATGSPHGRIAVATSA